MHLICINYNNTINNPFSAKKKTCSNTLYMCLDIHAKFSSDRPLWGRDLKRGSHPPPPPQLKLALKRPS